MLITQEANIGFISRLADSIIYFLPKIHETFENGLISAQGSSASLPPLRVLSWDPEGTQLAEGDVLFPLSQNTASKCILSYF